MQLLEIAPTLKRRLPVEMIEAPPEQRKTLTHTQRLRYMKRLLGVEDKVMRQWLSKLGEVKIRDGKKQLVPTGQISMSRYANWMAEKPPMAVWRMGAAIASLEWLTIEKVHYYLTHGVAEDDVRMKGLYLAMGAIIDFQADTELNAWMWEFREAIRRRLIIDAKHDETARQQLDRYSYILSTAQKLEPGKDDEEVSAPAE